jgi:hypothetical protein
MHEKPPCDKCRALNEKKGKEPPCDDCVPPLMPENREAFQIYMLVKNQFIMSMGGPVDVNHIAIWEAIDRYKVKDKVRCFEKVITACHHVIGLITEETKKKRNK